MNFSPFSFKDQHIGDVMIKKNVMVFLGNRKARLEVLKLAFPQFQFFTLQQTHSSKVVACDLKPPFADAHYSQSVNKALCVVTADCMPLLWTDFHWIFSIHIGWKGVVNNILDSTFNTYSHLKNKTQEHWGCIGPHILRESFEIDKDVKDMILKSQSPHPAFKEFGHKKKDKYYLDLSSLMNLKFQSQFHKKLNIFYRNTLIDYSYHSYRREQQQAGRNISFIVKLSH